MDKKPKRSAVEQVTWPPCLSVLTRVAHNLRRLLRALPSGAEYKGGFALRVLLDQVVQSIVQIVVEFERIPKLQSQKLTFSLFLNFS